MTRVPLVVLVLSGIAPGLAAQSPHALVAGDFRWTPVREGTDSAIVRQHFGAPDSVRALPSAPDNAGKTIIWTYRRFRLYFVQGSIHGVAGVETTDTSFVTSRGLRIGDPAAHVGSLYGEPMNPNADIWQYEDQAARLHVMQFTIRNGHVAAIYCGWILD